jgi:hypothetical protein
MSNKGLGKKLVAEERLFHSRDAGEVVTGVALVVNARSEGLDFVYEYPTGERIGVELARSPDDHDMAVYDGIWSDRTFFPMSQEHE